MAPPTFYYVLLLSNNHCSGAKHIPLSSERPFHSHCSIRALLLWWDKHNNILIKCQEWHSSFLQYIFSRALFLLFVWRHNCKNIFTIIKTLSRISLFWFIPIVFKQIIKKIEFFAILNYLYTKNKKIKFLTFDQNKFRQSEEIL